MKSIVSVFFISTLFAATAIAQGGGKVSGTIYLGNEDTVLHDAQVQIVELKRKTTTDGAGRF